MHSQTMGIAGFVRSQTASWVQTQVQTHCLAEFCNICLFDSQKNGHLQTLASSFPPHGNGFKFAICDARELGKQKN